MKNTNFLIRAFCNQFPPKVQFNLIEKEDYHILEVENPDERFNNHFGLYYIEGTTNIIIRNDDYNLLLELSKILKRYLEY